MNKQIIEAVKQFEGSFVHSPSVIRYSLVTGDFYLSMSAGEHERSKFVCSSSEYNQVVRELEQWQPSGEAA